MNKPIDLTDGDIKETIKTLERHKAQVNELNTDRIALYDRLIEDLKAMSRIEGDPVSAEDLREAFQKASSSD